MSNPPRLSDTQAGRGTCIFVSDIIFGPRGILRGVGGGPPSGFWSKKGQNAELKWGNERVSSAVRQTRNWEKGGGRPHSADQLLD
eukprot:69560-Chlamydomonas_euryale.AAC.1